MNAGLIGASTPVTIRRLGSHCLRGAAAAASSLRRRVDTLHRKHSSEQRVELRIHASVKCGRSYYSRSERSASPSVHIGDQTPWHDHSGAPCAADATGRGGLSAR